MTSAAAVDAQRDTGSDTNATAIDAPFHPVCPITHAPIRHLGMTVLGQVYEYDAIRRWLKTHGTDPMTNAMLPVRTVVRRDLPQSQDELTAMCNDMRDFTALWCGDLSMFDMAGRIAAVRAAAACIDATSSAWLAFVRRARTLWADVSGTPAIMPDLGHLDGLTLMTSYAPTGDQEARLVRPGTADTTGTGLAHVDLSSGLSSATHRGRQFKGTSFDGAILRGQRFFQCSFARSSFVCADLRGVELLYCDLRGENVCFGGALVDDQTRFYACHLEPVGQWRPCASEAEFRDALVARGMADTDARRVRVGGFRTA